MFKILAISSGGAIGALMRYYGSLLFSNLSKGIFPYGTMFVNLSGAFIIGLLWGIAEKGIISPNIRFFIFTGILGAFTTFSTYSLETVNLLRDNEIKFAILNIIVSNISGIVLTFIGYIICKGIYKIF